MFSLRASARALTRARIVLLSAATTSAVVGALVVAPLSAAAETPFDTTFTETPAFGVGAPVTVAFHGNLTTTTGAALSYTFDFGDGSDPVTSSVPDVRHTYTTTGSFVVTYHGKRGTSTGPDMKRTLTFRDPATLDVPYCSGGTPWTQVFGRCSGYARSTANQIFRVTGTGTGTTPVTVVKYLNNGANINGLSVYVVDDDRGGLRDATSQQLLEPGDPGYLAAAIARAKVLIAPGKIARSTDTGAVVSTTLPTHARVAFLLTPDPKGSVSVTLSTIAAANANGTAPALAYVGNAPSINADRAENGYLELGFEDLPENSDASYNDSVFLVPTVSDVSHAPRIVPYAGNATPVAAAVAVTTANGTTAPVALQATDADDDVLTYAVVANPQHGTLSGSGANLTYTPQAGYAGTDSFTYTASDAASTSTPATVSITVQHAAPVITSTAADIPSGKVDSAYSVQLQPKDDAVTWTLSDGSLPAGLTLSPSGLLAGRPTTAGTSSFTLQAATDGGTAQLRVPSLMIAPKDVAPAVTSTVADFRPAKVGKPYSQQLAATGTDPKWTVTTGALPDGLTLTSSGLLSGTPTAAGTSAFTLTAANDTDRDSLRVTAFVVDPRDVAPAFTTTAVQGPAKVGKPYTFQIGISGTNPVVGSTGDLPPGLALSKQGLLSGTPTADGTFAFTVTAANDSDSASQAFTLVVKPKDVAPTVTTTVPDLGSAKVGKAYSQQLAATGTDPQWSVTAGALPDGLTLTSSGLLSGTPTTDGTSAFTLTASNDTDSDSLRVPAFVVRPKDVPPAFTTTGVKSPGKVGSRYEFQIGTSGTDPVIGSTGDLPPGLTLSRQGLLSGTPTADGTYGFTVTATNDSATVSQAVTLLVKPKDVAPKVTTTVAGLGSAKVGKAYSQQLTATGTDPQWSVTAGALPDGLTLTPGGLLSGTPTTDGSFAFTLTASNDTDSDSLKVAAFVVEPKDLPPTVSTTSLKAATVGQAYSARIDGSGRPTPTWSVTDGALPNGIVLQPDGTLTGTPTAEGTATFTVTATNAAGNASRQLSIRVRTTPSITTTSLPDGADGKPYTATLAATGTGPITWSISDGSLPSGLSLDGATISGTPKVAADTAITVKATNEAGSATKALRLVIKPVAPVITTTALPQATGGSPYTATLAASGTKPIAWSVVAGALPKGLALDGTTGTISGTPVVTGSFAVTVKAANAVGAAQQQLTLSSAVPAVPAIVGPAKALSAAVGLPYLSKLDTLGQGNVTYAVVAGALPDGLVLGRTTGTITGVALRVQSADFTVTATNANGTGKRSFTLSTATVAPCGTAVCLGLLKGVPYTGQIPSSSDALTYSITSGALPAGLTLDPATGVLDGTPTTAGASTFTMKATTKAGSVTTTFVTTVHVPPVITGATTPQGVVGAAYTGAVTATGDAPLAFTVTDGALPLGLVLDRATGRITGIPRAAATSVATVTVATEWGSTSTKVTVAVVKK